MKKWSSQWMQFMQLRKEAWKKIPDFNRVWTRDLTIPVQCSTNWAMQPPLKWWIFFSGFFTQFHKLRSLWRSFLHFHFISAVHIWFISYIINTHLFHREHMNPQLTCSQHQWLHSSVGRGSHRWSRGQGLKPRWSPEFFFRLLTQLHELHSLRRSFLHFQ